MESSKVKRALISVSDKMGLADFARGLTAAGIEILSTGGTFRHLVAEGIPVVEVAEYTGFPEMMEGRVKTLHPKIHGGILGRPDRSDDAAAMASQQIEPFELVVVNLYPFEATVAKENVTDADAIENIDIGGPAMIRSAAKNHPYCAVVTAPGQYAEVLEQIEKTGTTTPAARRSLARDAFAHTAAYDAAIARYFNRQRDDGGFPETLSGRLIRKTVLRYGENPHQQAALYSDEKSRGASAVAARQLSGKELSYNNLLDLDAALAMVRAFADPTIVVLKHNNPCGGACATSLVEACRNAMEGDPLSAFGSILGFNRPVDSASAEFLATPGLFIEAMIAPSFTPEAVEILTTQPKWKGNVRLLECGDLSKTGVAWQFRPLEGGGLYQEADIHPDPEDEWSVVTDAKPTGTQWADFRFAWSLVRYVKSNAIVIAKNRMLLGVGAGQMSRVDSVEIAVKKAGGRIAGSVLASDAFFPFPDGLETAAQAGVTAFIQPGGSRNDGQVIDACNRFGLPMVFTGRRHFKH